MTRRVKLAERPVTPVAFIALVAKPDIPGRTAGVEWPKLLRGSCVLATVLAAVAETGGADTSGSRSRLLSVNSSFGGVKVS